MIKYSIIIPHKNDFTGLQKLLASIPRIKNIQIILVDDHSKMDIQEKILAEFSTDPAIDILQAKGSGAGAARNQGFLSILITIYILFLRKARGNKWKVLLKVQGRKGF